MRIIAGTLGGRTFDAPKNRKTHPMSDRVRGGMFNALGELTDLSVCDAFAGSGALGLEALSRGAGFAAFIESDNSAQKTIAANISALGVAPASKLIRTTLQAWLRTSQSQTFDVILCDPPYDDTQAEAVEALCGRLGEDGVLVLSWPGKAEAPTFDGVRLVRQKSYGDAQLAYYKR